VVTSEDAGAGADLVEVGRYLDAHGLVTSHGGNLSLRTARGALITATGAMLGRLDAGRLIEVGADGVPLESGARAPSSNTDIHLEIYARMPAAGAVVHAHPPYATARTVGSAEGWLFPANFEARLLFGGVEIVDGSGDDAPEVIARALLERPIVLVRGHGSFARGADPWEALMLTSALEEAAQVLTLAGPEVSAAGMPVTAPALLVLERDGHRRWQALVARHAPEERRGSDGWRLLDVVAHVAAWHRFAVARLGTIERREAPASVDADAFNADVLAAARGRAWEDVLAEAAVAHEAFLEAIRSAPAWVLSEREGFGAFVVAANGFGHYEEHLRDFERAP
jgi:ribulose-5-phosphate 4-epimerase/fuculose-1-phosphate aldolase